MLITLGKPGPISAVATVRSDRPERVTLMCGDETRQVDLGEISISQLGRLLAALRKSVSKLNPLVAKWGIAGARAIEIAQNAGYRGGASVLSHLIEVSQLPPEQFAQEFAKGIQAFPPLARMPHSLAFAQLIRDGMGAEDATKRLRELDSRVTRGMGGYHGGYMLARVAMGADSFPAPPRETREEARGSKPQDSLVVVHLDSGQVEIRATVPRAQAIRRAIEILQALQEQESVP